MVAITLRRWRSSPLLLYFRFPQAGESYGSTCRFTGVIVGLILEPVPGAVVAMVVYPSSPFFRRGCCLARSSSPSRFKFTVKSSRAVSGFSNSVIWLIFAAFMFGTGYENRAWTSHRADSGEKMGHRTLFLGYAVMFSS
ncbi:hypothetical protein DMI62_05835 [Escherichia coli]|nr:hypothetical protein [Escherichia coli]